MQQFDIGLKALLQLVTEKKAKVKFFSDFQGHPVTLTLAQGHLQLYALKGLATDYLWPKFGYSTAISV